jgi:hypothetical protein
VILVSDLNDGSAVACVETFDLLHREHPVRCRFAMSDAQFLLDVVSNAISAAEVATKACAKFYLMLPRFVGGVVHRVERCNPFNLGIAALEPEGYFRNGFSAKCATVLALRYPKAGEDAGLEIGIVGFYLLELSDGRIRKLQFDFAR